MHRRVFQIRMGDSIEKQDGPFAGRSLQNHLASGRKPERIITDEGTEVLDKHFKALLKDENIQLYSTYNETKAPVVKRLIRTLKTRMWRYFTAKKTM